MDNFSQLLSDPDALSKLISTVTSSLAGAIGEPSSESGGEKEESAFEIKPNIASLLSSFAGAGSPQKNDRKTALLIALKPFMRVERAAMIDKAVNMLNTAYTAKTAIGLISREQKG